MSTGRVYLVGAGPGDPGLITVRGRDLLAQADVVVYDYLSAPRLLDHAPDAAERIYVGKQAGKHTLGQDGINQLLIDKAKTGATVVRLKGGDPYVFGRGGEEALALLEAGIPFEVVPGITAAIAACAYAGIPVTHRTIASNLGFVTGHETPDKADSDLDFEALARWRGTLAFYMGVSNLGPICGSLIAHGLDADTPAALIRWGTTTRQEVLTGTVTDLPAKAAEAKFKPPALIVIGKVIALREKLNWFENRPLFGRRIVVTRARKQASGLVAQLEALGAEVIEAPTIRIEPPEDPAPLARAVADVASFDWIVLTSANGVDGFFGALHAAGLDARALHGVKVCTVGPVTAARLEGHGVRSDAQPKKFVAEKIADTLAGVQDVAGIKVLYPRADIAPEDLANTLRERGAEVRDVTAYRTVPDRSAAEEVAQRFVDETIHWITFTSSSTVKNFLSIVDVETVRRAGVKLASIGPVTSATLEEFGLRPDIQADPHTIPGLISAIISTESDKKEQP